MTTANDFLKFRTPGIHPCAWYEPDALRMLIQGYGDAVSSFVAEFPTLDEETRNELEPCAEFFAQIYTFFGIILCETEKDK